MIIEIAGKGQISQRLARELIADFVSGQEQPHFYIPESYTEQGMSNACTALDDLAEHSGIRIFEKLEGDQADILFVLDAGTEEELVSEYLTSGKKVFDLSRALFPVLRCP